MEIPESSITPNNWRFAFRTLKIRNFRLFFIGQVISLTGTWSQVIALSWLVWRLTNSTWWLGVVTFSSQIPTFLLGLIGGYTADRYPRLPSLILLQFLALLQALILFILVYIDVVNLSHIIILSLALGVMNAFNFPLRQAFVMDMVGKKNLLNAVALNSAVFHSTRIIGPMLAGFIIGSLGEAPCFAINAVSFLFLIVTLMLINKNEIVPQERDNTKFIKAIINGLKYSWGKPVIRITLLLVSVASGIGFIYIPLLPVFADKIYGGGAEELGWLMASTGMGAFIGSLILAKRENPAGLLKLAINSFLVLSLSLIIFSRLSNKYMGMSALVFVGLFLTMVMASSSTFLQQQVPNQLRGKTMSLFVITFFGLLPIFSIIAGAVAEKIGAENTITIGGAISLAAGIILYIKTIRFFGEDDDRFKRDSQLSGI